LLQPNERRRGPEAIRHSEVPLGRAVVERAVDPSPDERFAAPSKIHAGLALDCPILAMHSDEADIVLDWKQVAHWSRTLGKHVTVQQFPGALHDLVLSRREIREEVFRQLFAWEARSMA